MMRLTEEELFKKKRSRLVELALKIDTDKHADEYADEMKELCSLLGDEIDFMGFYANELIFDENGNFCGNKWNIDVHALGVAAKFLARLYLLGNGDMRSFEILKNVDVTLGDFVASAEIEIPICFSWVFSQGFLLGIEPMEDFELMPEQPDNSIRVRVTSVAYGTSRTARNDSNRFAASAVCLEVFDTIEDGYSTFQLNVDWESGTWGVKRVNPFVHCVIDEIASGHIAACANCGRPIYIERLNASPFCNRGHYNRYREKAHRRFDKGWTFKQIHEAFPALSEDLIIDWFQLKDAIETVPYHGLEGDYDD